MPITDTVNLLWNEKGGRFFDLENYTNVTSNSLIRYDVVLRQDLDTLCVTIS